MTITQETVSTGERVIALVRKLLEESGSERSRFNVTPGSSLDRDLGIGSLERVELLIRVEEEFGVQIAPSLASRIRTVEDLAAAVALSPERAGASAMKPHGELSISRADPSKGATLVDVLGEYAASEPDRPHIYLQEEDGSEEVIRYGRLYERSLPVAAGLAAAGLKKRDTVAIMLPTSSDFFYAFMGVLLAGCVPVPIYPPFRADQIEEYARREAGILGNAEVRVMITFGRAHSLSRMLKGFIPSLKEVATVESLSRVRGSVAPPELDGEDPALIQYTSGSTGNPKGVLLTHFNLLSNIRAIEAAIPLRGDEVVVSWLPLYHDMGLIGAWLGSLYHGMPVTIMSPLIFLTRPERWLWAMHYHRATISAAPNFAYELCARRVADSSIEGLDLSSVRLLLNGAEAVSPATLRRFSAKFKKYGLSPQSFYPVYGLAESSLAVAFPDAREGPVIDRIRRGEYERERRAVPAGERDKNFLEFACCGKALPGHEIRIVDDEGKPAGERRIGHLQFRGPSCMQGYYRNPGATAEIYRDGWWESGDMAYMDGKGVYITGRIKDMIIKAGRNIYPPEVEDVAGSVEGVRTGCVVSFGVGDAERGTEDLVIVAESSERSAGARDRIVAEITGRVSGAIGLPPDRVVLVPPRTIKKTSSGKLRRSECREDFLKGRLGVRARPAWFQVASLYAKSGIIKLTALAGISGRGVYTLYAAALACVLGAPLISVLFAMPAGMSRAVGKLYARSLFLLLACPLFVKGRENLNAGGGAVYVINHSSYLDTIVCTAALPAGTLFVGKRELFESFLPGVFLRKLGHIPIEREDFDASVASVNGVTRALLDGNSLALFAEGTFTYAAGLRPFKLGAFKAAAEAGVPVFPVAMRGTRAMLRDGSVLLRPGVISIRIGEPVMPEGAGWDSIVRLRDRVRAEIAKHCGEPTIDLVRAGHGS